MPDYKVLKNVVGSSLLYGNTVYFLESGELVPYILVQPGNSDNFLFMRKYAPSDKVAFFAEAANSGTTASQRIYEGNTLDRFLSETFYNRFTAEWQKIFVTNGISVTKLVNENGVGYSIYRKVFAASATELGVGQQDNGTVPEESPFGAYRYFKTSARSKRKCQVENENGDYVEYWTRSKNNHVGVTFNYYALSIDKNGGYDTATWQKNSFHVRPVISINENVTIVNENGSWRIIPNLPPEKPSAYHKLITKNNGDEIELKWNASSDNDGPDIVHYRIQKRIDSGEWENIEETSDTSFTKVIGYKEAESQIEYRVQAFDAYSNASEWTQLYTVTVVNNLPPSAPSYISVNGKYKGEQVIVAWGSSSDRDNNLAGYKVFRSINGGAYAEVSTLTATTFRDVAGDWDSVKYKVIAYDESGAESEGKESSVLLTSRITMEVYVDGDIQEGSLFSWASNGSDYDVNLTVSISDTVDDESYLVIASLDDKDIYEESNVLKDNGSAFTISKEMFQKIPNGEHVLKVTVYNSQNQSVSQNLNFSKHITGVYLTLKNPVVVDTDDTVSKFLVNVIGSFPEGSSLVVKVTNNAKDSSPVWQTVSANEMNTNEFIEFTNKNTVNGSAFNIIVEANRGTATEECYISSVNGMFGRNIFEYIFERLDALEAGAANV